jgi:hypothetical protein
MTTIRSATLLAVVLALAGCSGGTSSPTSTGTGVAKGKFGQNYYVNIFTVPAGGRVVSVDASGNPDGILNCGDGASTCGTKNTDGFYQTSFAWGATARLTAVATSPKTFISWAGDCGGVSTCTLSNGADKTVIAIFSAPGSGHPNFTDPALHGPAYTAFLSSAPGALQCTKCHGANLQGQAVAPSCSACHDWPLPAPVIDSFIATPISITNGQSAVLSWSVTDATSLSIDQGVGAVTGSTVTVKPTATTTYTLTATNPSGSSVATITLPVQAAPQPPTIVSFSASPSSITVGQSAMLSWSVTDATSLSIDQGVGAVTGSSVTVNPAATTTYTLAATSVNGTTARSATVTVTAASCTSGGGFALTGSLNVPREVATATLLRDGTVLVTGGTNTGGFAMASSETYDPSNGRFTLAGSMNTARIGHTATLLPSGKVLIAGGSQQWSTTPTFRSAELYDPVTRTFTYTGSLNVARYVHTATLLPNGKVLIAGGDQYGYQPPQTELYDPATGTFTLTGSLSTGRAFPVATLLGNGQVMVAAGYRYNVPQASAELFAPATGSFTTIGSMKMARGGLLSAATLPDGRVLVAGGQTTSGGSTTSAEVFDPVSGTFSFTGSMADPRSNHVTIGVLGGKVLVAGGLDFQTGTFFATAELYDATTGLFIPTSGMSVPKANAGAALLSNGSVLVVGGANATGPLGIAEVYTPHCGGITGIGAQASLASIPSGSNGFCWFGNMERAVQTAADGLTRVATTEHRFCDTGVDRIRVHTRDATGAWSSQVPFSYDYSAYRPTDTVWYRGLPGTIAGAVDAAGGMHVVVQNNRSTSSYYDFANGLVYAWGGAATWQAVETGVGDGPVQVASGNSSGAPYSGLGLESLAYDPGAALLRFIGHDGAWWATAYHVLETTAGPGGVPAWAPFDVVATSIGAVDRGAILAEAQDFDAGGGVQVWVDGPTCRLKGRELRAGIWSQTIDLPLGYAGCSYQSSDYFGFFGRADVFLRGTHLEVVIFARLQAGSEDILRFTRTNGAWTVHPPWPTRPLNGDSAGKAFADRGGDTYALHLNSAGALSVYDFSTGTDVQLRLPAVGAVLFQADCALWNPTTLTWTERLGGTETLYAAPFLR